MTNHVAIANAFDRFDLASCAPRWSSWALEQFIDEITIEQSRSMIDLIHGLDLALARHSVTLTEGMAHFLRDVSTVGFLRHGPWWTSADWGWVFNQSLENLSPARAYLLLLNLPPDRLTSSLHAAILDALGGTAWHSEALAAFDGESDVSDPHAEVSHQAISIDTSAPISG